MKVSYEKKTAILSGSRINFIKNTVDRPRPMTSPHWHSVYEILYVRKGRGIQQINSESFEFERGSVTVICPGDVHTTVSTSPDGCEIDVLQFAKEYFGAREDLLLDMRSTFIEEADMEIKELFDKIYANAYSNKVSEMLITSGSVLTLCGVLWEYSSSVMSAAPQNEFTRAVCEHLRNTDDVRLKSVSQRFGYSPEHFSRKFHSRMGISYKDYCVKIKIQKILKTLDNSASSLEEVSHMLGYSGTSSFVRSFKRIYGLTPGAYKRLKNQLY